MNNQSVPEHLTKIEKELKELKKYLKRIPKEEAENLCEGDRDFIEDLHTYFLGTSSSIDKSFKKIKNLLRVARNNEREATRVEIVKKKQEINTILKQRKVQQWEAVKQWGLINGFDELICSGKPWKTTVHDHWIRAMIPKGFTVEYVATEQVDSDSEPLLQESLSSLQLQVLDVFSKTHEYDYLKVKKKPYLFVYINSPVVGRITYWTKFDDESLNNLIKGNEA